MTVPDVNKLIPGTTMGEAAMNESREPLTEAEWDRALAWATELVAQGHHYRCNVNRGGGECDCYFRSGKYQAARRLVALGAANSQPQADK